MNPASKTAGAGAAAGLRLNIRNTSPKSTKIGATAGATAATVMKQNASSKKSQNDIGPF